MEKELHQSRVAELLRLRQQHHTCRLRLRSHGETLVRHADTGIELSHRSIQRLKKPVRFRHPFRNRTDKNFAASLRSRSRGRCPGFQAVDYASQRRCRSDGQFRDASGRDVLFAPRQIQAFQVCCV